MTPTTECKIEQVMKALGVYNRDAISLFKKKKSDWSLYGRVQLGHVDGYTGITGEELDRLGLDYASVRRDDGWQSIDPSKLKAFSLHFTTKPSVDATAVASTEGLVVKCREIERGDA